MKSSVLLASALATAGLQAAQVEEIEVIGRDVNLVGSATGQSH